METEGTTETAETAETKGRMLSAVIATSLGLCGLCGLQKSATTPIANSSLLIIKGAVAVATTP